IVHIDEPAQVRREPIQSRQRIDDGVRNGLVEARRAPNDLGLPAVQTHTPVGQGDVPGSEWIRIEAATSVKERCGILSSIRFEDEALQGIDGRKALDDITQALSQRGTRTRDGAMTLTDRLQTLENQVVVFTR